MKSVALVAALALSAAATTAGAATLSLTGAGSTTTISNNDLGLGLNGQTITYFTGDIKDSTMGLAVSAPAKVTYTYLGFEAGNSNYAANLGGTIFTTGVTATNATATATQWVAGLIDLSFGTTAPAGSIGLISNNGGASPVDGRYAIGYLQESATSFLVLFDDISGGDRDFDDIGVRVSVAPVPVPAAGLLLVGAIGGLAALRRRKAAA